MRLISSAPRPHVTRRRYRLRSQAPSAPSAIIATAAQITVAIRPPSATCVFETVMPAETSAITSPLASSIGTTARTDGPSVPV